MTIRFTVVKKARRLTFTGWLSVVFICVVLFFVWLFTIHDFLAVNKPLKTSVWVIEGYVPDFVLDSIADVWKTNPEIMIVCAGLPIRKGEPCFGYNSHADYNMAVLLSKGVDSLRVFSAPTQPVGKDRTYTTALAAREKLNALGYSSGEVNVVCLGTHARRSRFLYRKAFQPEWTVGVISYPDDAYPKQWWHTSEGARAVVYEMFACFYCFIFFHP